MTLAPRPLGLPRALWFALVFLVSGLLHAADAPAIAFDIPAGPAAEALKQFSAQSGEQLLFSSSGLEGVRTNAVQGSLPPNEALNALLRDTGLVARQDPKTKAFSVRKETPAESKNVSRVARKESDHPSDQKDEVTGTIKLETFEVMGTKLLNMDKRRSIDDPQPYVVFDRTMIEQSGAIDVNDFLKTRLSMNAEPQSTVANTNSFIGAVSVVNLRGLGATQTLVLIDGHRTAVATNSTSGSNIFQANLNSIPLAAIERIEVLPSTASGIYGGGATGGVINVILRRDYQGLDVKLSYQNTFRSDSAIRGLDFAAGLSLEGGKTNILLSGSCSDQNALLIQDRDFIARGRANVLRNNPGFYSTLTGDLPLGSTPNIRSTNGANLVLKNGTPLNSFYTFVPRGYAGAASDGGVALVANAGRYNLDLPANSQINTTAGSGLYYPLLHQPTRASLALSARRQFTPWLQAFVEVSGSDTSFHESLDSTLASAITLPATAATNPFTSSVLVEVPADNIPSIQSVWNQTRRATAGLIGQLPFDWKAEIDFSWSSTRQAYALPPAVSAAGTAALTSGTIDVLRDPALYSLNLTGNLRNAFGSYTAKPFGATSADWSARLSGPFGSLRSGPVTVLTSLEYRSDALKDAILPSVSTTTYVPRRTQSVTSSYLEVQVPLVAAANHVSFVRQLDLQAAGRFDRYLTHGASSSVPLGQENTIVRLSNTSNSVNPTVALRYQPRADLAFRASYGTGFLPPAVNQLIPNAPLANANLGLDPRRGNSSTIGQATGGGNPALHPEESKSTSIGLIATPRRIAGLRLSVDYTAIRKTDNIATLTTQQIIDNEGVLSDRVTRGPNLPGDLPGWPGPITAVNNTLVNISAAEVRACDIRIDYEHKAGRQGLVTLFAAGTRTLHYQTQIAPSTPVIENVGYAPGSFTATTNPPPRLKASGGVSWKNRGLTLGWNFSYVSPYHNYNASDSLATRTPKILNQGNAEGLVPSQIYHDLFAGFRVAESGTSRWSRWIARSEFQVGVKNVFNTSPPFDATNTLYYYSYYGDPHLRTYYLSVRQSF